MKDKKLEQEFGEYFKGLETPDNITESAKKYAAKRRPALTKVVKYLSVAASLILVCAVALTFVFGTHSFRNTAESPGDGSQDIGNSANVPDSPNASAPDSPNAGDGDEEPSPDGLRTYSAASLAFESRDAYTVSQLDPALSIIEKFAFSNNAQVTECEAGYLDGELANVRAEVTYIGAARDDTELYLEFTEADAVYEPLTEYLYGTARTYNGYRYYLTEGTADNGELYYKLFIMRDEVKYYFYVTSSDEQSYVKYLKMIAD